MGVNGAGWVSVEAVQVVDPVEMQTASHFVADSARAQDLIDEMSCRGDQVASRESP
jgi:hypothetical protein